MNATFTFVELGAERSWTLLGYVLFKMWMAKEKTMHLNMIKKLLQEGARANVRIGSAVSASIHPTGVRYRSGWSLICFAIEVLQSEEVVCLLVEHEPALWKERSDNEDALKRHSTFHLCHDKRMPKACACLLKAGATVDFPSVQLEQDTTFLKIVRILCEWGHVESFHRLSSCNIVRGGLPLFNLPLFEGTTPLHIAFRYGCVDLVRYLAERNSALSDSIFSRDQTGMTPFCYACEEGRVEVIFFCLCHWRRVPIEDHFLLHRSENGSLALLMLDEACRKRLLDHVERKVKDLEVLQTPEKMENFLFSPA